MSSHDVLDEDMEDLLCDAFDRPSPGNGSIDFSFDGCEFPLDDDADSILSPVSNASSGLQAPRTALEVIERQCAHKLQIKWLWALNFNLAILKSFSFQSNNRESRCPVGKGHASSRDRQSFEPLSPVSVVSEDSAFWSPCETKFSYTVLDSSLESTIPVIIEAHIDSYLRLSNRVLHELGLHD